MASASPDRHNMTCVVKASGNDPRVGVRAHQNRWTRLSGDGDVICTCSSDDFCACRAEAQHRGKGAKQMRSGLIEQGVWTGPRGHASTMLNKRELAERGRSKLMSSEGRSRG